MCSNLVFDYDQGKRIEIGLEVSVRNGVILCQLLLTSLLP
jgi:hypothetical protein